MQSDSPKKLTVLKIGLKQYADVWELQKKLQKELIEKQIQDTLIVCEHPPVITLGTSAKQDNILSSTEQLKKLEIELHKTERGGDVTCHAPGQIVLYPLFDLRLHKTDVAWYMRNLEEAIIKTLAAYDIEGLRIAGKTGVWTDEKHKIASIGVRISRWCTMHGLALNVKDCTEIFRHINPCGYRDIEITEMQKLTKIILDKNEVTNNLIRSVSEVFKFDSIKEEPELKDKNI